MVTPLSDDREACVERTYEERQTRGGGRKERAELPGPGPSLYGPATTVASRNRNGKETDDDVYLTPNNRSPQSGDGAGAEAAKRDTTSVAGLTGKVGSRARAALSGARGADAQRALQRQSAATAAATTLPTAEPPSPLTLAAACEGERDFAASAIRRDPTSPPLPPLTIGPAAACAPGMPPIAELAAMDDKAALTTCLRAIREYQAFMTSVQAGEDLALSQPPPPRPGARQRNGPRTPQAPPSPDEMAASAASTEAAADRVNVGDKAACGSASDSDVAPPTVSGAPPAEDPPLPAPTNTGVPMASKKRKVKPRRPLSPPPSTASARPSRRRATRGAPRVKPSNGDDAGSRSPGGASAAR
jgi:hypothetical protein